MFQRSDTLVAGQKYGVDKGVWVTDEAVPTSEQALGAKSEASHDCASLRLNLPGRGAELTP
jgi:hypothetical protein